MARSSALRIGPRRFELVVLEGSAKRHKIAAYHVGEFSIEDAAALAEGDISGAAAALKEAAKAHRVAGENLSVVMATDHAAFRRTSVPLTDRSKIDAVVKGEIEGDLPQFDIDEVVVDYHVMHENEQGAELLVTAVPKIDAQTVISLCEKAGLEPLEMELEGTAIVNAAFTADMCHIDDAQLLVHVGEHSTSVAVVAGAELRELRVIHIGAMSHLAHELDLEQDAGGDGDGGEDAQPEIDEVEIQRRMDQAVKRIKRELGRTISAARTPQTIDAIYVSGTELPGLVGSEVLGVPIYVLDCFEEDSGQPADGFGQLVAAYGGAVRQIGGGVLKPSLRRDELRYTGTWERLEFPVAFAALMLATFLGMLNIFQYKKISHLENGEILPRLNASNKWAFGTESDLDSDPIMVLKGEDRELFERSEKYQKARSVAQIPDDLPPPIDEFRNVRDAIVKLQGGFEGYGDDGNIPYPPSAFNAITLVLDRLRANEEWRPSIREISGTYQDEDTRAGLPEHIEIEMDMTFFADDPVQGSAHFDGFKRDVRAQPWCLRIEDVSVEALGNSGGIIVENLKIKVVPSRAPALSSN